MTGESIAHVVSRCSDEKEARVSCNLQEREFCMTVYQKDSRLMNTHVERRRISYERRHFRSIVAISPLATFRATQPVKSSQFYQNTHNTHSVRSYHLRMT